MTFIGTATTIQLQQKLDKHRRSTFKRQYEKGRIHVSTLLSDQDRTENLLLNNTNTANTVADMLLVEKEESVSSPTNQTQMAQVRATLSPALTSPGNNAGAHAFSSTITNQIYVQNESAEFVTTGDKKFK